MTTSEPVKSFTTELTPEAKAKWICILYSIKPEKSNFWTVRTPEGILGKFTVWEAADMVNKSALSRGEQSSVEQEDIYPDLTTDFLLRVARENGIDHEIVWRGDGYDLYSAYLRENKNAHGYCGDRPDIESDAESTDPTEALYLALLRFRGEEPK